LGKKHPYKKTKGAQSAKEPNVEYSQKKRLNFQLHDSFEEMDAAKQAAFMKLSPAERLLKGLELYRMFKDHFQREPDPKSFVLRK